MKFSKFRADDLPGLESCEILIGDDWYLYAGTAYIDGELGWSITNFFLDGVYRGQLGKLIAPNDFKIIARPQQ